MSLTVSDPATYTVPSGQALLFTETENENTVYKYKLSSGSIGTTTLAIIKALDVKPAELPCLVYSADLLSCMNENFVSAGEMTIALAQKASVKYVKQLADQKVSKATFLSTIAEMPTNTEMNTALSAKANASDVATSLSGKANSSDVYTQAETQALLESFIGAITVADITELNALEPGVYRFVWVLDPSDDDNLENKDVPALYRWRVAQENVPAGYEFLQSATSGAFAGTIQEILNILGDSSTSQAGDGTIQGSIKSLENSLNGKQSTITGTAGQFVKMGANNTMVAETVDFSNLGSVKSVNNVSPDANGNISLTIPEGTVKTVNNTAPDANGNVTLSIMSGTVTSVNNVSPDANGNVTLTIPSDLSDLTDSNDTISTMQGQISTLEAASHTHVISTDNYNYSSVIYGAGTQSAYISFSEMEIDETVAANVTSVKSFTNGYTVIGNDKLMFAPTGTTTFNGIFVDETGTLTGIKDAAMTNSLVIAAIDGEGALYVRGLPAITTANINAIPSGGNLLGAGYPASANDKISKDAWTAVNDGIVYTKINAHTDHWVALSDAGDIYTAGVQNYHLQANASYSGQTNALTKITVSGLSAGQKFVDVQTGRYYSMAVLGTVTDGVMAGKIYLWGNQIHGCIGDGVSWLHDTGGKIYRAYANGATIVYTVPASTSSVAVTLGMEVYSFANNHVELVGTAEEATDGSSLTVNGVVYTRNSAEDIDANSIGTATPTPLAVPTLAYAYESAAGTVVYATTDTPAKNTVVYSDNTCTTALTKKATSGGYGYLVLDSVTYNRVRYKDHMLSSVVYDDWFKVSAGYYHVGALRKNSNNETEVYLWGSNEYGQLGTGNYTGASMTSSTLTGSEALNVELVNRPMKLPTSLFPYTDVVDIMCNHYGTFLIRANGKIYFAGCNKRNYLGTGVFSDETAFIPKFTALSTRFTGNKVYAETYGSIVVHETPSLSNEADPLIASVFTSPLTTEKLDAAISATHNHSIDTAVIDAVAIAAAQYADQLPAVAAASHTHTNMTSLNALSVMNDSLYINGVLYSSGSGSSGSGSGSGTGVVVDPSNVPLDSLTDITGLNNLAGGLGLEIISCRNDYTSAAIQLTNENIGQYDSRTYPLSASQNGTFTNTTIDATTHVGSWIKPGVSYIRVAPVGNSLQNRCGRFVTLYNSSKNAISGLSADDQAKGLYGVPSNNTSGAGYINCTKDLVTMIEKVKTSSSAHLRLYYVDVDHAASPASGTQYLDLLGSTLAGYGTLYWQMDTGTTIQPVSEYLSTDELPSLGLGDYSNEEEKFFNVYTAAGALLLDGTVEEYYLGNGDALENIASLVKSPGTAYAWEYDGTTIYTIAKSPSAGSDYFSTPSFDAAAGTITSVGEGSIVVGGNTYTRNDESDTDAYHTLYFDSELTDIALTPEQIAAGLYMKQANKLVKIREYMIPEEFNEELFSRTNGEIYIHPSKSNYYGMANQRYEFDIESGIAFKYSTTTGSENQLESVIIKLNDAIELQDETSSSLLTPRAGSLDDPMYAAIKSTNRFSTSSASGEYNSAVGFNSTVSGNQNTVFGDMSEAKGLGNLVVGDMSFAQGFQNVTIANKSIASGNGNIVAGEENIAIGSGNLMHGYYGLTVGSGNQTFGNNDVAIGQRNLIYTLIGGATAVGDNNIIRDKAKDSVVVGNGLDNYAEGAIVVGHKAVVPKFDTTNFPGEDTSTIALITATAYANAGYDTKFNGNKEGLFFGAGLRENNANVTIFPMSFTKYMVRPNPAYFGDNNATTSARSAIDPYIFEPRMQWTFIGTMGMYFTDPQVRPNDATQFTFSKRFGGRVKTFDAGIEDNSASDVTLDIDFDKATRWKIKGSGVTTLQPINFVDGAEAYIVAYAGSSIAWNLFTAATSTAEGINEFDALVWGGGSQIDPSSYTTGFALLKLHIVDNTCIIEVVANTLQA